LNEQAENLKRVKWGERVIVLAILATLAIGVGIKVNDGSQTPVSQNSSPVSNQTASNQQPATSPEVLPRRKGMTNRVGMEFVWIRPGSFTMGSEKGEDNEKPAHQVTIREGLYMGKYEVTQAQWRQAMGTNPSESKSDGLPVGNVSWSDAQQFIGKLNEMNDGFVYRLPSEAEWEYACRAGTTGDDVGNLASMAWYNDNSGGQAHPVGQKRANAFGLYDMHGNVWEWCVDTWHKDYNGAPADGSAWTTGGDINLRALRGGSWLSVAAICGFSNRGGYYPRTRDRDNGVRVVATARK
jgi:formylglycine-generating enzyme required for sulfatase activity